MIGEISMVWLIFVLSGVAMAIAAQIHQWGKTRLPENQVALANEVINLLMQTITVVVESNNQQGIGGAEAKKRAVEVAKRFLAQHGLSQYEYLVDDIIEMAVKSAKPFKDGATASLGFSSSAGGITNITNVSQ